MVEWEVRKAIKKKQTHLKLGNKIKMKQTCPEYITEKKEAKKQWGNI